MAAIVLGVLAIGFHLPAARAEQVAIPAPLQATLLARAAAYDRSLGERSGSRVRIGVLVNPSDPLSHRAAAMLVDALREMSDIGGLPQDVELFEWRGAAALTAACAARHLSVLYLSGGFDSEAATVATAVASTKLLTVASSSDAVRSGIVLGFELVGGRPKLFVNLGRAQEQAIRFNANLLKLATVFP